MPFHDDGDVRIRYEVAGDGYPILLIAPGGMRSEGAIWDRMAWNPKELPGYQVIAMDQRNAGQSSGPVSAADGWDTYLGDQLGLLDHLGVEACHVIGMCIGGPYIAGLLKAAPERFASAVILQPVGIDENRRALEEMFDSWAADIADRHPHMSEQDWVSFRTNMWGGEFLLTASAADMADIDTPMLVLMGDDLYHPESTSRELVATAPDARLIEDWKDGDALSAADRAIRDFLDEHTP